MMQPHQVTHLLKDARCRLARPHSLCGTLPALAGSVLLLTSHRGRLLCADETLGFSL